MPSRIERRLAAMLAAGSDPGVKELAGCSQSADRLSRRLRRWLAAHPPACRCGCCAALRLTGGRDPISGLAAVLEAVAGIVAADRPRTRNEFPG